MGELKSSGKSFEISKWEVQEAYEKVKANRGAPGVDGCSIEDFEKDLKNNLYRIWNRMSSAWIHRPDCDRERVVTGEVPFDLGRLELLTLRNPSSKGHLVDAIVAYGG